MKSLAMPALYVFSIVLAVGIGMGQAEKESRGEIGKGSNPNCVYRITVSTGCWTSTGSLEDCPRTRLIGVSTFFGSKNYRNDFSRSQCGSRPGGVFTPDPRCQVEPTTPTSDGCE
jgi:hypothetical protein